MESLSELVQSRFGWSSSCILVAGSQIVSIVMVLVGSMVSIINNSKVCKGETEKLIKNDPNNNYGSDDCNIA